MAGDSRSQVTAAAEQKQWECSRGRYLNSRDWSLFSFFFLTFFQGLLLFFTKSIELPSVALILAPFTSSTAACFLHVGCKLQIKLRVYNTLRMQRYYSSWRWHCFFSLGSIRTTAGCAIQQWVLKLVHVLSPSDIKIARKRRTELGTARSSELSLAVSQFRVGILEWPESRSVCRYTKRDPDDRRLGGPAFPDTQVGLRLLFL